MFALIVACAPLSVFVSPGVVVGVVFALLFGAAVFGAACGGVWFALVLPVE